MKCPNCKKRMDYDFCIFCGYMKNGNMIERNKKTIISDLEIYLGKDYDKIVRNTTYISTFILGPLYISYKKFFWIGTFLTAVEIGIIYFIGMIVGYLQILAGNFAIPAMILSLIFFRIIWMTIANGIYLNLVKLKLDRLKKKNEDSYYSYINKDIKKSNILYPLLSIAFYIFLVVVALFIYKLK